MSKLEWQKHLSDEVFERLADCVSRKSDIPVLVNTLRTYSEKHRYEEKESTLAYMLEWVVDWNNASWDYSESEYENWLSLII